MAISASDSYGAYLDTGSNTIVTQRANVEVEVHTALEVDTGSKTAPVNEATTHVPHRPVGSPR